LYDIENGSDADDDDNSIPKCFRDGFVQRLESAIIEDILEEVVCDRKVGHVHAGVRQVGRHGLAAVHGVHCDLICRSQPIEKRRGGEIVETAERREEVTEEWDVEDGHILL
jgi:hypothetical protein